MGFSLDLSLIIGNATSLPRIIALKIFLSVISLVVFVEF